MTDLRTVAAAALKDYRLSLHGLHGPTHWLRVLRNGRDLVARTPGADLAVVERFALLHDCRRENDETDPQHGRRAADYARCLGHNGLGLDAAQLVLLTSACARHELGEV